MQDRFGFIQTHPSHLVNPEHIARISSDTGFVLLTDGIKVKVSSRKKDEVLQELKTR